MLEADGPIFARLRTHDPRLHQEMMNLLEINQEQLWDMVQPYAGYPGDFRPRLKERQRLTGLYITKLTQT